MFQNTSDLMSLIGILVMHFSEDPPVYQSAPPSNVQPPYPTQRKFLKRKKRQIFFFLPIDLMNL